MGQQIKATGGDQGQGQTAVEVNRYPDSCPICHRGIEAKLTGQAHVDVDLEKRLQVVFQCPRHQCQSFFVSTYLPRSAPPSRVYLYAGSAPLKPVPLEFPEQTSSLSPMFRQIFNEARNAELQDWKLIAGPGYRKSSRVSGQGLPL